MKCVSDEMTSVWPSLTHWEMRPASQHLIHTEAACISTFSYSQLGTNKFEVSPADIDTDLIPPCSAMAHLNLETVCSK